VVVLLEFNKPYRFW